MNSISEKIWKLRVENTCKDIFERFKELDILDDDNIKIKARRLKKIARSDNYKKNYEKFITDYLVESFSLCMVAVKRFKNFTVHKVQIMAAIGLTEGFVVEQKTGEGKTITGVFPAFLYGLLDKNCHIVTVNPYLTKRDGEDNGKILEYLGLSVGIVLDDMSSFKKREEYSKDVVYVSNTELGFDYLRDQITLNKDELMIDSFDYAIIDEVDSILIDEAKTPLIISSSGDKDSKVLYTKTTLAVNKLKRGDESEKYSLAREFSGHERFETGDYYVKEKERQVVLTDMGLRNLEDYFHIKNISDDKYNELMHAINNSLYAKEILKKDRDYMIKDGKVQIIDEFTGRIMDGRSYSNGLHQAIEAKEKVNITEISDVSASITHQNFFRKYEKLAGMTGTAKSESKEFKSTYNLDVIEIPTNKPVIRKDYNDKLYLRRDDKYKAVIEKTKEVHKKGQPILLATASLFESEYLSSLLDKEGLNHKTLNAKQDENEANIIKKAGEFGQITVATNMAGRGTDIKLSEKAKDAGGLFVIGTEKHESKRIDNQLRGRSGRQGDVGESVFYLSTEDRIMKDYGSDIFLKYLKNTQFDNGEEITDKRIKKAIKKSQDRVSLDNFKRREDTLYFDDVDNVLRERLLKVRRHVLVDDSIDYSKFYRSALKKSLDLGIDFDSYASRYIGSFIFRDDYKEDKLLDDFEIKVKLNKNKTAQKQIILLCLDEGMKDLIKALDYLRSSVNYVSYGGIEVRDYYNEKAYEIFIDIYNRTSVYMTKSYFKSFKDTFMEDKNAI